MGLTRSRARTPWRSAGTPVARFIQISGGAGSERASASSIEGSVSAANRPKAPSLDSEGIRKAPQPLKLATASASFS